MSTAQATSTNQATSTSSHAVQTSIESNAFPGIFLRADAPIPNPPTSAAHFGTVNCQAGAGPYEQFYLNVISTTNGLSQVYIRSAQFGAYLSINPQGNSGFNPAGYGKVDCQIGYEGNLFYLLSNPDGSYSFESVTYPGIYLRLDPQGGTQPAAAGFGTVNCQGSRGAWEKFKLELVPSQS